jgi:RNA polymerase sigma-70 factor (ECF subfamily)
LDNAKSDRLAEIIAGCKAGDDRCFCDLLDLYGSRCYGYFYRLCGDRSLSDDLLSELFVKLVEKIGSYKGGAFEGWLFRVASNIFYDHLRSRQRQQKLLEAQKNELELEQQYARYDDGEMSDKLQTQLARLDDDTRQLILLRFYSQMSFKEMAKVRSEPIGTTLSKLHRGLRKLRQLME